MVSDSCFWTFEAESNANSGNTYKLEICKGGSDPVVTCYPPSAPRRGGVGSSKVIILFMLIEFELSSSQEKKPLIELVIQFLSVQVEWL